MVKRIALSELQKFQVVQHHLKYPHLKHEELAQFVARSFNLAVSRSSISKLLKRKAKYQYGDDSKHSASVKRARKPKFQELEKALSAWFWKTEKAAVISDDLVIQKAKEFAADPRLRVDAGMKFSQGWLEKFKKRHGIRGFYLHGEGGAVDESIVEEARKISKTLLSEYSLSDIYNMDETGLFYRMSPRRALATELRKGRKKQKERVTLALCSNASGSDKMAPLLIGKSKNPRCFRGARVENLGIFYRSNKSAWMKGDVFEEWLKIFSARARGRQVVLLLDNASSHHAPLGDLDFEGGLYVCRYSERVLIVFLPPNLTSAIQPMDQGIIAAFKAYYRSSFLKWNLRKLEDQEDENPRLNLLEAIHFVTRAWGKVEDKTIRNCFRHSGLLGASQQADSRIECKRGAHGIEKSVLDGLAESLDELKVEDCLSVAEFACPGEEQETEPVATNEEIIEEVLPQDAAERIVESSSGSEPDDDPPPRIPHSSANSALWMLYYYFQRSEKRYEDVEYHLDKIWDAFDDNLSRCRKQTKITDFFKAREFHE